jgi:short-subunit dehydrogenase
MTIWHRERVPTVLVTGASSGIGAAFVRRYAQLGYDLVLVARDEDRLARTADELRAAYHVTAEVLPADLASDEGVASVEQRLADATRPVDVLINNAGFGLGADLLKSAVGDEERLLRVMVIAPMRLTKAALPGMVERGVGSIVLVSSVAGLIVTNSYGAAKAWGVAFSRAVAAQLAGTGVRAMALCPGLVHTEFHERGHVDVSQAPDFMWLDADQVVDECLRDLAHGKVVSIPSRRYRLLVGLGRLTPTRLRVRVAQDRGLRRRHYARRP